MEPLCLHAAALTAAACSGCYSYASAEHHFSMEYFIWPNSSWAAACSGPGGDISLTPFLLQWLGSHAQSLQQPMLLLHGHSLSHPCMPSCSTLRSALWLGESGRPEKALPCDAVYRFGGLQTRGSSALKCQCALILGRKQVKEAKSSLKPSSSFTYICMLYFSSLSWLMSSAFLLFLLTAAGVSNISTSTMHTVEYEPPCLSKSS